MALTTKTLPHSASPSQTRGPRKSNNPLLPQTKGDFKPKFDRGVFTKTDTSNITKDTLKRDLPGVTPDSKYVVKNSNNSSGISVTVFAQRSSKPAPAKHYANEDHGMQAGINKRQAAARAAEMSNMHARTAQNQYSQGLNAANWMNLAQQVAGLGLSGLSAFRAPASTTTNPTQTPTGGAGNPGGTSTTNFPADSSIGKMHAANTPAGLRDAISGAETRLSSLPGLISSKETAMSELFETEEAYNAAKTEVNTAKSTMGQTQKLINTKQAEVSRLTSQVNVTTEAYNTACQHVTSTKQALETAERNLSNPPEGADLSELKQAVYEARQQYSDALKEQKEALMNKEGALTQLDETETQLREALTTLAQLEKQLSNAEKTVAENEAQLQQYDNLKQEIADLKSEQQALPGEIEAQKTRLQQMITRTEQETEALFKKQGAQQAKKDALDGSTSSIDARKATRAGNAVTRLETQINQKIESLGLDRMTNGQTIILDGVTYTAGDNHTFTTQNGDLTVSYSLEELKNIVRQDYDNSLG